MRLSALAALAAALTLLSPATARASCLWTTAAQKLASATFVFDGVALDGITPSGIERFRVERAHKGSPPAIVGVRTGRRLLGDGRRVVISVGVEASPGERWRIYATRLPGGGLTTSVCAGSRRVALAAPPPQGEGEAAGRPRRIALAAAAAVLVAGALLAVAMLRARRRASG